MKHRSLTPFVVACLVFLVACLALLVACGHSQRKFSRVVFVTIDTLRADHLAAYGYPRATSPFFDRLAQDGVLFQNAVATMATTIPAHSAMFTSRYPAETGVVSNSKVLDDDFVTLAERFQDAGYSTAAFVSAGHLGLANLDQGFDVYDQPIDEIRHARPGNETIEAALEWLAKQGSDEDFFVWIHLFEPHQPYDFHPQQQEQIEAAHPMPDAALAAYLLNDEHIDLRTYRGDRARMLATIRAYDSEVRFADDLLGMFFAAMGKRDMLEDSLWIVTADHGEGLGNHRWMDHGKHIYNEQLRVPLVFWAGDHRWKATSVAPLVEQIDLLPTLVAIERLGDSGEQPMEGTSMLPLLEGDLRGFPAKIAFSQRRSFDNLDLAEIDPDRSIQYESGERYAVQTLRYKYLLWTDGADEFYDLRTDPYELNNLAARGGSAARDLRRTLLRRLKVYEREASPAATVEPRGLETLRALGYLQ